MNVFELRQCLTGLEAMSIDQNIEVFIQRENFASPLMKVTKIRYDAMQDGSDIIVIEGQEL